MRRDLEHQRGVLEGHRDGVVRDRLNGNLDTLRDLGLDVVLRRHPRRREEPALAGPLERGQRDVEVEGAVDGAERQADREVASGAESRRPCSTLVVGGARVARARVPGGRRRPCSGTRAESCSEPARPAVEAPLDAERAGEVASGLDDAGLDFDLRLGAVERDRVRRPRRAWRVGP